MTSATATAVRMLSLNVEETTVRREAYVPGDAGSSGSKPV